MTFDTNYFHFVLNKVVVTRWTGQPPVSGCPGFINGIITSLPLPDVSSNGSRQKLLEYFDNTWTLTEVLFSGLLVTIESEDPCFLSWKIHIVMFSGQRCFQEISMASAAASNDLLLRPRCLRLREQASRGWATCSGARILDDYDDEMIVSFSVKCELVFLV